VRAHEREDEIDWPGLRRTLANVQHELGKPFVAKNVLAAHHVARTTEALGPVVWVLVERDPLDACVSILDARRRYYGDARTWWSYVPPEYPLLNDLDEWEQIAGQVHYLTRLYERQLATVHPGCVVRLSLEAVCTGPGEALEAVQASAAGAYGYELGLREPPPPSFPFHRYTDRDEEKERFGLLLQALHARA
jgi:hypothetical protein